MMIHLRRNTTARNSRSVAWRPVGTVDGWVIWFTLASPPARHDENPVEVEQLLPDQRRGEHLLRRGEQLVREDLQAGDGGARHVDDVETRQRDVGRWGAGL